MHRNSRKNQRSERQNPYFQVYLNQDLFGDWTQIKVWDGIGSNRGRMHSSGVASYEAGIKQVDEIARRRFQRGYASIPPL